MQNEKKSDYEETQALREARRKHAAASIVTRYELARQITGQSGAERVALLTLTKLLKQ